MYDDYLSIREHLPKKVTNILDIGCGFGGLAALLQVHYAPETTPHFHLVEQARIPGAEFSRPTPDAPDLDPLACAAELLIAIEKTPIETPHISTHHANSSYNAVGLAGAFGDPRAPYCIAHYLAEWIYDDYLSIREHLPKKVTNILDIGCGFGGLAALLQVHYAPETTPHFHLVEQARIPGAEFSRPTPDAPDLDPLACAAELLIANGVADAQVHTIASDNAKALYKNKYDLIVSMRSWCYLYPIETYIEVVRTALRPGGTFLVDVHKNLGGLAALCAYLPDATLVSERQDLVRCLYVKTS